jgi:uracil permease
MFPATVLVALLTHFDVGATLVASGLATVVALVLSGFRIPLYYGSSFSYIAALAALMATIDPTCAATTGACPNAVSVAQVGILGTAVIQIIIGLLIRFGGRGLIERLLPPIVTGPVALIIGLSLAKPALDNAVTHWGVALVTLLVTIGWAVYGRGRGLLGMLPVLAGTLIGYAVAWTLGVVSFTGAADVGAAAWIRMPGLTLPDFTHPQALMAVLAIAPIAIATIPESTAHLYQLSLYVDRLADDLGRRRPNLRGLLGLNLILDGIGDMICGLLGGPAGTNYGENNSLAAITRSFSAWTFLAAGVLAIALGFLGKLAAVIYSLPPAVVGGLEIYLFGVIGLQGVALLQSEAVDLFDPAQLAVGALVLIIGIGGGAFPGGNLPIFGRELPAIATAALVGILLNLVFSLIPPPRPPRGDGGTPAPSALDVAETGA